MRECIASVRSERRLLLKKDLQMQSFLRRSFFMPQQKTRHMAPSVVRKSVRQQRIPANNERIFRN